MKMDTDAYDRGMDDWKDGVPPGECPYISETDIDQWYAGYAGRRQACLDNGGEDA
jgi:hypothetical protein